MSAVRADGLTKVYARYGRRRSIGTFKSALLSGGVARALAPDARFPALSDVSFAIEPGQTVGVIGENGSGKSTLLKLLAGILKPTAGTLETHGRVAALIELGAGFHPEITARENIEINALLLGLSRKEIARRFDSIVSFAGVEDFLDSPVKTFSSGMVVRLGFAVAAHVDPEILLVDEVLAVGDEAFVHRCLERIAEFQRQGRTLILVSHDLERVAAHCPRALRLSKGKLVADGPAAEVIGRYREEVARVEGRARLEDGQGSGDRWGSGIARIQTVKLLNRDGQETRVPASGDPIRLQMEGEALSPLDDFVAGFQISRVDGAVVFGSNTHLDRTPPGRVSGFFRIALEIEKADLAQGVYSVDAAVHSADGAPYDYRRDVLRFEVLTPENTPGVWLPKRTWRASQEP